MMNNGLFVISIIIVAIAGWLLHHFFSMPLWGAMLVVVVVMVANGAIAEWEDNQPGGLNDPDSGLDSNDKAS